MELSEKEIENFIYDDLIENQGRGLEDRGLSLNWFMMRECKILWVRQLNIDPYGIIDIVGFYRFCGVVYVELIELKKTSIDANHFEQICRYKQGLSVYLKNTFKNIPIKISMSLIGSLYSGLYIQNNLPVDVYAFDFDLSGITFEPTFKFSTWQINSGSEKSFRKTSINLKKILNGKAI